MRMRFGASMLVALVGLLGSTQFASAQHFGANRFSAHNQPCCDAQISYSACQQQCQTSYKLVYDTVLEQRWHTCYKQVKQTVMKQVQKTCYKTECKTCYRDCVK